MQHNAHPPSLVHTPWRPDASQNRQGSRAHPETPRNTPKRPKTCRPEDGDCLVELGAVGQFSFYRSWHHQNFRRVGWGPHRQNSQSPIPARLSDQNGIILTDLFLLQVRAGEINVDKTFPPKTLDRSRDSSDFDFAKVLARGRSRATHSDCDTGSERDTILLSNLQPAAET